MTDTIDSHIDSKMSESNRFEIADPKNIVNVTVLILESFQIEKAVMVEMILLVKLWRITLGRMV